MFRASIALLAASASAASLIQVDRRAQVSRADLHYDTPASRPEEGMPIGNGRMGSLVWTTPSALHLQINRVDVHAMDDTSFSFPRADSDYGSGCGYVDIHVVQSGDDVFTGTPFRQHLSLYDALMTAQGKGVSVRAVAWPNGDVMAIDVDDQRAAPEPINIDLRMLRYQMQFAVGKTWEQRQNHTVIYRTAAHTATSILGIKDGRITLTQQFREGTFYDSSAVAIAITGRASRARYLNDNTVQLSAAPAKGRFTIWIGTAASAILDQDTAALALRQIDSRSFETIRESTAEWWHNYWSKGMVYLHSTSGQADFVEANYTEYLYLMGSASRGDYPSRFGGGLWQTDGDMSRWGSQYWWANTSAYYTGLMPANRMEIIDPLFKLYLGMYDACATAARQQWGSEGIYIPEITAFSGPEKLPDDIAAELRDLMLARKPFEQRSEKFEWYQQNKNRHTSRWNYRNDGDWDHGYYIFKSKGSGIFGHTTHILGVATRLGSLAWQRYQLTQDESWLREKAYPIIKGAAEFYRHFPNLQKDEQGVYHINHTNSGESSWDSRDAPYEVSCLHMIFPLAMRASEILGVDADLRPAWKEILDHLVPMAGTVRGFAGGPGRNAFGAFVYNGPGAIDPIGPEPEIKSRFLGFTRLGSFIDDKGIGGAKIFRNRLRLREGPGAIDAEHLAGLTAGVHASLLDSHPESVTSAEPVKVFAEWPMDWDAAFTLLARGNFLISAAQQNGKVPSVEIVSQSGGTLRLSNPWGAAPVTVFHGGRKEDASGEVLDIPTAKGETVIVVPRGQSPAPVKLL
jgi:Glycosyl hydrolase family 95 catalytic domain